MTPADVLSRAAILAEELFETGGLRDAEGAFPSLALDKLRAAGLLRAPFPVTLGGAGFDKAEAAPQLFALLRCIGGADLSVGRLYEGHINAVQLVLRYGTERQSEALAEAVAAGALSAVWNAESRSGGLTLVQSETGLRLQGAKILASGAGDVARPIVTAETPQGLVMILPRLEPGTRADISGWTAAGMRSSATGRVDLTGLPVSAEECIGVPGDYKIQPAFSGGAWRFCAVQLGGAERLFDLFRQHLNQTGRGDDPYQRQRIAHCAAAIETAALWVAQAAAMVAAAVQAPADETRRIVAYVGLTRMVVERAALDVLEATQRGVGLAAFLRPNPIERVARDLATYLRQPAPDGAMADAAGYVLSAGASARTLWGKP